MKKYFMPVLLELLSAALSLTLIHFLLAPFLSSITDVSYGTMYGYLATLLFLFTCARILSVLRGNDWLTAMISKWMKR
ncbi:MAG: hypothetical protein V4448_05765 [Pseudomonadota bacterium]|jgi:hypothetical protein